jgi:hypothetical protein
VHRKTGAQAECIGKQGRRQSASENRGRNNHSMYNKNLDSTEIASISFAQIRPDRAVGQRFLMSGCCRLELGMDAARGRADRAAVRPHNSAMASGGEGLLAAQQGEHKSLPVRRLLTARSRRNLVATSRSRCMLSGPTALRAERRPRRGVTPRRPPNGPKSDAHRALRLKLFWL